MKSQDLRRPERQETPFRAPKSPEWRQVRAAPAGRSAGSRGPRRSADAFGLVLVLVLVTYVLTSLLSDNGWTGVLITLSTTATSIVALTSSHARPELVRRAICWSRP